MQLRVWVSSFIPASIPALTKPVPNHPGQTMIPGPLPGVSDCFKTDQRTFTASPTASSRMRSLIKIDTVSMALVSQEHHCDNTVECDCEDGATECEKAPDNANLKVESFSSAGDQCTFTFKGAAGNPCFTAGAPMIEWVLNVIVKRTGVGVLVKLGPGSVVEPFPAFEMYASADSGAVKVIFTRSPDAGAGPGDLYGDPMKPVTGTAAFP